MPLGRFSPNGSHYRKSSNLDLCKYILFCFHYAACSQNIGRGKNKHTHALLPIGSKLKLCDWLYVFICTK